MNTEMQEAKKLKTLKDPGVLKGKWKLTYILVNSEGPRGFGGKTISSYTDPYTGKGRHLFNPDGQFLPGFLIDKTTIFFDPERKPYQRLILDWLIGHPEVGIEKDHVQLPEEYFDKKISNPRIKLVNLDHRETVDLEEEDYVDKLIGQISLDTGANAISLLKLRYILSQLKMPYHNPKLINDNAKEKLFLRKSLKNYVRQSYENAQEVNMILDNLAEAKYLYEIKEMVRFGILHQSNGMYKYNGMPLGISVESVIKYFTNNIEVYDELSEKLALKFKKQN